MIILDFFKKKMGYFCKKIKKYLVIIFLKTNFKLHLLLIKSVSLFLFYSYFLFLKLKINKNPKFILIFFILKLSIKNNFIKLYYQISFIIFNF